MSNVYAEMKTVGIIIIITMELSVSARVTSRNKLQPTIELVVIYFEHEESQVSYCMANT